MNYLSAQRSNVGEEHNSLIHGFNDYIFEKKKKIIEISYLNQPFCCFSQQHKTSSTFVIQLNFIQINFVDFIYSLSELNEYLIKLIW